MPDELGPGEVAPAVRRLRHEPVVIEDGFEKTIGVDVCRKCGRGIKGTHHHPTIKPFHVQCRSHDQCYVLCMDKHPKDHYPEPLWPAWERANA